MREIYTNNHTTPFHFPPLGEVRWGVLFAILALFASCKDETESLSPTGNPDFELRSIDAVISTSATRTTRASANNDYIGRDVFVSGDRMVLTKMQRTSKPLDGFIYAGVNYGYSGSAWDRTVDASGKPTDDNPDRIFWSDNASPHTFIGYALPQTWGTPADVQTNGKWVNTEGRYSGQFTCKIEGNKKIVDFSAIDTELEDILDSDKEPTGQKIDKKGTKLKKEDLLLTNSTTMFADPGGLTTTLHYKHALASLRVIIDIQSFSPSTYAEDVRTTVDNLVVLNQPYKYTWHSAIVGDKYTMSDGTDIPGWGVANSTTNDDGTVEIKTWQPRPQGEGSGQAKVFTFYSLIVPGKQTGFAIKYKVHYPKYLNPSEIQEKEYQAELKDENGAPVTIDFLPGYTTTIRVSLNHDGEPVYIGAEYIDWENVETPDRSDLQKISIFLDTDKRTDITIVGDSKATKDDATWLYNDGTNVVDIYGNDGTVNKPYTIKTARQLLSFAFEVKSGRTFAGKYIKLDSDIYLQKTTDGTDIIWPGVGDDTKNSEGKYIHAFDGVFLGDSRYIKGLNGQPFFNTIGDYAVVDKVNFSKVINVVGAGVVANVNKGLIAGCNVEGNVNQAKPTGLGESYCGSIVGDNTSFIVACTHVGDVTGYGYVGGLVGRNAGALVASYHAGNVTYAPDATDGQKKNIGGSTGLKDSKKSIIFSCYQNGDLATHEPVLLPCRAAWPLTTLQMQSDSFVNSDDDNIFDLETSTPTDGYSPYIEGAQNHYSLNKALQEFSLWVQAKAATNEPVVLPCHSFTAAQVKTLNALFSKTVGGQLSPAHLYKYSPGTYPKVQ